MTKGNDAAYTREGVSEASFIDLEEGDVVVVGYQNFMPIASGTSVIASTGIVRPHCPLLLRHALDGNMTQHLLRANFQLIASALDADRRSRAGGVTAEGDFPCSRQTQVVATRVGMSMVTIRVMREDVVSAAGGVLVSTEFWNVKTRVWNFYDSECTTDKNGAPSLPAVSWRITLCSRCKPQTVSHQTATPHIVDMETLACLTVVLPGDARAGYCTLTLQATELPGMDTLPEPARSKYRVRVFQDATMIAEDSSLRVGAPPCCAEPHLLISNVRYVHVYTAFNLSLVRDC